MDATSTLLLAPGPLQSLNVSNLEKANSKAREEGAKQLKDYGVTFGPLWQSAVMVQCAAGVAVADLPRMMNLEAPGPWDPLDPVLGACSFGAAEKGRVLLRVLVHDRLLQLISEEAAGVEKLKALLDAMRPFDPALFEHEALKEACNQLADLVKFFEMLMGQFSGEDASVLDTVAQSSGKGALTIVKRSVGNSPYWKSLLKQTRQSLVSLSTMLPDVRKSMEQLKEVTTCKPWCEVVPKIPAWKDALPPLALQSFFEMLNEFVRVKWNDCKSQKVLDGCVLEFIELTRTLRTALPQDEGYKEFNLAALDLQKHLLAEAASSKLRACLTAWTQDRSVVLLQV